MGAMINERIPGREFYNRILSIVWVGNRERVYRSHQSQFVFENAVQTRTKVDLLRIPNLETVYIL
jgi:hypothetical protein